MGQQKVAAQGRQYLKLNDLENGPMEQRECRDIFCLILFAINVGAMVYCSIYAYTKGDPSLIYRGTDVDNNICGIGNTLAYPYLYFINPTSLDMTKRICVANCPVYQSGVLQSLTCYTNSAVSNCNYDYIVSENGQGVSAGSTPPGLNNLGYSTVQTLNRICFPSVAALDYMNGNTLNKVGTALTNLMSGGYLSNFINDIMNNWQILLGGFFVAIVISYIVIFLMRCFTGCLVWISILGTIVSIIGLGFILTYSGGLFGDTNVTILGYKIPTINGDTQYYKYYGYACWVGGGLFLLITLCCCGRIRLAVAVCKCAGAFLLQVCSVMFVPIIMALATVALWVVCCICMIWLVSAAPFVANGDVFTSIVDYRDLSLARFYYFIFATLWSNALLQSVTTFVIASACCMWYYQHGPGSDLHLPVLRSFGRAIRYHLGSLAFGSLLLAIVQFIQFMFEILRKQLQNTGAANNRIVQYTTNCTRCCLACLERIVQFINKNAYILIAYKGDNFCASAKQGFQIAWSNPLRFAVVNGIGSMIMFVGKLLIACATTGSVYAFVTFTIYAKVLSPLLFLLLVFVYSYAIGAVFMTVYDLSMDTLLMCFIVDETLQKQKKGKALHAPEQLAELMD